MSNVSVALTTYNGAEYILKQLQSLLLQTRPADEVIICDDCSRDETVSIIRRFLAEHNLSHWHLHENSGNLGFVQNFRQAMSLTTGEIVFLCDQDDIWTADKIRLMTDILDTNPNVTALACGYRLIDSNDSPIQQHTKKFYRVPAGTPALSQVAYGPILYYNIAQGCACCYRRELVNAFCAVEHFGAMPHDWALNLMAHQAGGLYFLNEELLLYRIHGHNAIGIDTPGAGHGERVRRLRKFAAELEGGLYLPLQDSDRDEIRAILDCTAARISWLESRKLSLWIRGLFRHSHVLKHYFFWQYAKDLVLAVLGRIPKSN